MFFCKSGEPRQNGKTSATKRWRDPSQTALCGQIPPRCLADALGRALDNCHFAVSPPGDLTKEHIAGSKDE
ncbi:MAG: hypothetical protein AUJ72_02465 [Candidatus Omnitrophica bacterium CG1_02_46_14]|nr:MAG: hypothetical protein AUJ72_02465 [Candidatus Omnitrophica bacterium CG1_02_46_14]